MIQYLFGLYLILTFNSNFYTPCISFWNEFLEWELSDKISFFSAIGTILSAIIAIGAILLTYKTISEMKRQRETSIQPHLTIIPSEFYITYKKPNNRFYFSLSPISADRLDEDVPEENSERLVVPQWEKGISLSLTNIGLGAAHNITGFWSYPLNDMLKQIEENESKKNPGSTLIYIGGSTLKSIRSFQIKFSQIKTDSSFHEKCAKFAQSERVSLSSPIAIPISMSDNPVFIAIPILFIEALCVNHIQSIPEKIDEKFVQIPSSLRTLTVNIKFLDIANIERKFAYNIDFYIHFNKSSNSWNEETGSKHIDQLQGEIRVYPIESK